MTGEFDWLLKPIRPDAPRDILRRDPVPAPRDPLPPGKEPPWPPRIHIQIEIDGRQTKPPPQRSGIATFIAFIVLVVIALALCRCAAAQPTSWQSYRQGFSTIYQGSDAQGRTWTGRGYQQGFTTYGDFNGPNGETLHCATYELSGTTHTSCY